MSAGLAAWWVLPAMLAVLVLSILIAFARLVRGPSLPDRVVALDLIATAAMGMMAVYAIATRQAVFLDVAIIMALINFLSTVAFARYVEIRAGSVPRRERRDG